MLSNLPIEHVKRAGIAMFPPNQKALLIPYLDVVVASLRDAKPIAAE